MKELKQMLWMVLGVVGGFGLGLCILLLIFDRTDAIGKNPTLALFVAVPILGGGLVGGGYLAQWLVYKYQKARKKKRQAAKEQDRLKKRKK